MIQDKPPISWRILSIPVNSRSASRSWAVHEPPLRVINKDRQDNPGLSCASLLIVVSVLASLGMLWLGLGRGLCRIRRWRWLRIPLMRLPGLP